MSMHLLVLSLITALSAFLGVVASFRLEPFYSFIVRNIPSLNIRFTPRIKTLYSAREAIEELREIRIRDGYQEELQAIHEILIGEYGFDQQYYPISLRFMHNSFEMEYADGRKQGRRQTSRDDLLSLVDSKISNTLGRVAAYAWLVAIAAFVALIILAVI